MHWLFDGRFLMSSKSKSLLQAISICFDSLRQTSLSRDETMWHEFDQTILGNADHKIAFLTARLEFLISRKQGPQYQLETFHTIGSAIEAGSSTTFS
jgi:hypothetical protein